MPSNRHTRTDQERLLDIVESARLIEKFVRELDAAVDIDDPEAEQIAILHLLIVIGEASAHVSEDLRVKHPQVPWLTMSDFRNELVHEYFGVDWNQVYAAATSRVPLVAKQIKMVLRDEFN